MDVEQAADRVDELGPVHRVEVQVGHAGVDQAEHLLGGDVGGDQLAGVRIVLEPGEAGRQPGRDRRAALGREAARLLEVLHRHDARHDRDVDAAGSDAIDVAEVVVVVEEELRDRPVGAGVDLGGEHVEVGVDGRALGVLLGVRRHRDLGVVEALDAGDQIGGVAVAVGVRLVAVADAAGGIAAQGDDVAHARLPVAPDHVVDRRSRLTDAGDVGGRGHRRLADEALDGRVAALGVGAVGAVGDRHEVRPERLELADRPPQRVRSVRRLGREDLERDTHHATSSW